MPLSAAAAPVPPDTTLLTTAWFRGELSGEMLTSGRSGGATAMLEQATPGETAPFPFPGVPVGLELLMACTTASRGRCTSTEPSSVE